VKTSLVKLYSPRNLDGWILLKLVNNDLVNCIKHLKCASIYIYHSKIFQFLPKAPFFSFSYDHSQEMSCYLFLYVLIKSSRVLTVSWDVYLWTVLRFDRFIRCHNRTTQTSKHLFFIWDPYGLQVGVPGLIICILTTKQTAHATIIQWPDMDYEQEIC
jgi:hypothetical protein